MGTVGQVLTSTGASSLPIWTSFGTGLFTPGSVIFAGATGALTQDNANFFWNDTLNVLSTANLQVAGGTLPNSAIAQFAPNLATFKYGVALTNVTSGLRAAWTFNDGLFSTTVADVSGIGNTLNLINPQTFGWVPGNTYQNAGKFDGVNSYGQSSNSSGFSTGNASRTLSAWFKWSAGGVILTYGNATTPRDITIMAYANRPAVFTNGLTDGYYINTILDSNWHHIAFVHNSVGNVNTLYFDGVASAMTQVGAGFTTLNTTSGIATVGIYGDGSTSPFNGSIQDARVYNTALTAGNITTIYNFRPAYNAIGVGTTTPQYMFDVNGTMSANKIVFGDTTAPNANILNGIGNAHFINGNLTQAYLALEPYGVYGIGSGAGGAGGYFTDYGGSFTASLGDNSNGYAGGFADGSGNTAHLADGTNAGIFTDTIGNTITLGNGVNAALLYGGLYGVYSSASAGYMAGHFDDSSSNLVELATNGNGGSYAIKATGLSLISVLGNDSFNVTSTFGDSVGSRYHAANFDSGEGYYASFGTQNTVGNVSGGSAGYLQDGVGNSVSIADGTYATNITGWVNIVSNSSDFNASFADDTDGWSGNFYDSSGFSVTLANSQKALWSADGYSTTILNDGIASFKSKEDFSDLWFRVRSTNPNTTNLSANSDGTNKDYAFAAVANLQYDLEEDLFNFQFSPNDSTTGLSMSNSVIWNLDTGIWDFYYATNFHGQIFADSIVNVGGIPAIEPSGSTILYFGSTGITSILMDTINVPSLSPSSAVGTDSSRNLISISVPVFGVNGIVGLTNQSADIASTALTSGSGIYNVECILQDTTADLTAGAVILTLSWTDGAGATTATATQLLTGTGRQTVNIPVHVASGNLTFAVTHTGIFGSAKYALYIRVLTL